MKKTLTLITMLAGAVSAYSQGTVLYYDYNSSATVGFKVHIYAPQLNGTQLTGNSASGDAPPGTTTGYTGGLIGAAATTPGGYNFNIGSDYDVELFAAGGTVTTFASLSPIPSTVLTISSGSFAGLFLAASQTITFGGTSGTAGAPTVAEGSPVTLALACWYNSGGLYTTLAQAEAASVPYGLSTLGTENAQGGTGNTTPATYLPGPGDTYNITSGGNPGISSFSISGTPEPSTIALGVIGASAFLMRLRRKQ